MPAATTGAVTATPFTIPMPLFGCWYMEARANGFIAGGTNGVAAFLSSAVVNATNGGTPTSTTITSNFACTGGIYSVTPLTITTSAGHFSVNVTGLAGQTINWTAYIALYMA